MLAPAFRSSHADIPVVKTIASKQEGIDELVNKMKGLMSAGMLNEKKYMLLAEKVYHLVQQRRMKDVNKNSLQEMLRGAMKRDDFNLYRFAEKI